MPLAATVSPAITTRFQEVQEVLSLIQAGESVPPARDPNAIRLLRGLFYVHLYGAFEYSVNRIVTGAAQDINAAQVPHHNVTHTLGTLVLDGMFNAIGQPGRQWKGRLDLIQTRISATIAQIDDGSVGSQNIWLETLEEIFQVFGIAAPVMFDVTKTGYINEVVEARNKIAHGQDSPLVYGTLKRSPELNVVFDAIRSEAFYILDCFENYLVAAQYKLVP
jgi:hypothetical protein